MGGREPPPILFMLHGKRLAAQASLNIRVCVTAVQQSWDGGVFCFLFSRVQEFGLEHHRNRWSMVLERSVIAIIAFDR